jgi:nucleotide-binding universal stress UspA family protein
LAKYTGESAMPGILVALDGSTGSERALEAAIRLAQLDGGSVSAITVVERKDDQRHETPDEAATDQLRHQSDELLQTAANFARSRGVLLSPILREGDPANTIIACVKDEDVALVVLGANSKARPGDLGDTADQIARHSSCTVMIVR